MQMREKAVVDAFHDLYYNRLDGDEPLFMHTYWMGVPCLKCPLDLWIYQEIIVELRPDLIVETGTSLGGSALFMAHMLDLVGKGELITIDVVDVPRTPHPRIRYVAGSSADPGLVRSVFDGRPEEVRLIVLDSDHSKSHVLGELALFAPYVSRNSYIIVEDTNLNGHPTYPAFGDGPYEAVETFLAGNTDFVVDERREKFMMTFNPRGFLKRIS